MPGRKPLVTLRDAALFITKLPKAEHEAPEWLAAALGGSFLWPAHAWRGRLDGQHLTRPPPVGHPCGATPLGRHQKQRSPVGAPEHAGEAASID